MLVGDALQLALLLAAIVLALLAVEVKDLLAAAVSLGGMCAVLAMLFWLLSAPYVAVFQLAIYAGAVLVLFVATIYLTRRR